MLVVALKLLNGHDAKGDDDESRVKATVPVGAVELEVGIESFTVTVHGLATFATVDADPQLRRVWVVCTLTVRLNEPGDPAEWSVSPE